MTIEIKAPTFPESVADGVVSAWHKAAGESVARDELLVEIETDKVVMEVVAPAPGVIEAILVGEGETILSETLLATLVEGEAAEVQQTTVKSDNDQPAPASAEPSVSDSVPMGPAVRTLLDEQGLEATSITASGKGGRLLKEDVLAHMADLEKTGVQERDVPVTEAVGLDVAGPTSGRIEKRVPMTRMRARIAERLLDATQQTAMLTTFNEVNMAPLMKLRRQYKEQFEATHNGTRLGFMGFFVRAACEALKRFPAVNASIDGNDVVYHGYQDIGVAVSIDEGLVVPILRDADFMSIADIEAAVHDLGVKARDKKLTIEEMTGGTFTVSNGGVFGSLLSTPILNPPQTGILGMHTIQDRPIAMDGEVVIQPMMYLALSYDHRLVDGKTAVQFLVAIKGLIEDPARILLQL
ncbi:MAG: 2-oxoglutarate dehydrogenase complex dihydrolipoyllysine-residue succinyltransferase [Halieaceae bacterium]|jgi:2-oxoglutarate dehydrogenase E2 component (dihydrolipoamide succinyltransferase)|nr:2-oxoglutarate dehydrogenase complex dihydrolipoyllysine-residue succinyltransferase [Halieaceae bacterium]MBT5888240.1 2-oxoglutarate dehydrogenase complex dihydrolipoyllysine-residue succinyltransferase [Halieaceae bacterium]